MSPRGQFTLSPDNCDDPASARCCSANSNNSPISSLAWGDIEPGISFSPLGPSRSAQSLLFFGIG